MAKVHIWYQSSGEITAIGQAMETFSCLPVCGENQYVLELEMDESSLSSLAQTHMVDPLQGMVVRRGAEGRPERR